MASSRRAVIAGAAVLAAGCIGPDLNQDAPEESDADEEQPEPFDRDDLDELVATVREAIGVIEEAAGAFAAWEEDPSGADVSTFEELQTDATDLWSRYGTDVLTHAEELREGDWSSWDGDPEALADLLPDHEELLGDVEAGALGLQEGAADPAAIGGSRRDAIDRVVTEGPDVVATTTAALPD